MSSFTPITIERVEVLRNRIGTMGRTWLQIRLSAQPPSLWTDEFYVQWDQAQIAHKQGVRLEGTNLVTQWRIDDVEYNLLPHVRQIIEEVNAVYIKEEASHDDADSWRQTQLEQARRQVEDINKRFGFK